MLMSALIVFGTLSFKRLGISQLPDVDSPVVSVGLSLPGAAPEVMEAQVVDPVEDAIMQIGGVRSLTSNSSQSSGSIAVEFELDRNIDEAVQEVQNRINQVRNLLPASLYAPTVRKSNPEDQPILWIALVSDGTVSTVDTMIYARNYLYNQFGTVEGVGDIAMGGYVDPALRVWVDLNKLKKFQLTSDDVVNAITAEHVEVPAGRIENPKKEYNVRLLGEAPNPVEFGKILINNRSGGGANYRPQQIKDVAKVEESTVDVRKISRFNLQPAVGLGILKQHGSNAVEVARLVREKLKEIEPLVPKGFKLSVRADNTRFIKQSVDELNFTLVLSAILTSLVCFFFLGSWTSTFNVLLAIPTSIVGTFIAIFFMGFTLNTFTLLGLSLAIGIVVDDAIMMLENIVRHQQLGEGKKEAALKGSKEITFAALAATIAVVAIFLPVIFMKGVIGRYFYQYGVTVSVAVLLSLLEALTLTPMRCAQYLTIQHHGQGLAGRIDRAFTKLADAYRSVLALLLRHRWKTVAVTLVLFAISVSTSRLLKSEMMPAQDQSMLLIRLKAPVGSALPFTDKKMRMAEEYLAKLPESDGVFSMVGGFGGDAVASGQITVTLVDRNKRKKSQAELQKEIRPVLLKMLNADMAGSGFSDASAGGGGHGERAKRGEGGDGGHGDWAKRGEGGGGHGDWAKRGEGGGGGHGDWAKHDNAAAPVAAASPDPAASPAPAVASTDDGGGGRRGRRGGGRQMDNMIQVIIQDMSLRGFSAGRGFPVEFIVEGPDWDKLTTSTNQLMDALNKTGAFTDINTDITPKMREIKLTPNREKMAARGVPIKTVTTDVNALVGGAILNGQTEYAKAGHRYQIEARLVGDQRDKKEQLSDILVRNNRGEMTKLSDLVDVDEQSSLQTITRLNRARSITVYGNPAPGRSQQDALALVQKTAREVLPAGYVVKLTGSSQSFKESFDSLMFALLLGIVVSYMVLASQFNSFIHPVTVLMALPFSVSGAFIALLICRQSLNIYSLIGFILLMGIVKKNSILLVDFTNQCRDEGMNATDALLHACPVRLRPILMTSIAIVAGALPEAMSLGPGAETTIPMAITIIGGVIASTILTLFVVPCAYSLMTKLERPDPLAVAEQAARKAGLVGGVQPVHT
jgi:multidrug efflux pump subunit AcrB